MHIILFVVLLMFLISAAPQPADAQQSKTVPRIGYLSRGYKPTPATPDLKAEAFREGLRDRGYIEGTNIFVEFRYAEGDAKRFPMLLAELLQLQVDVLVSGTIHAIRAAKQATKTTPILFITQGDPVADGLVDSLARPGGNLTGLTRFSRELSGKRLEIFKEAVPGVSRVGLLGDGGALAIRTRLKEYESAAHALKIQFQSLEVRDPTHDLTDAFNVAAKRRANGILIVPSPVLDRSAKLIAKFAIKNRLPSMTEEGHWVEAGSLLSYAANDAENFRRAAYYVDRILKGSKPADLPVEQPTKFEFVINLKTANQIGVTIPPSVLARADRVIR